MAVSGPPCWAACAPVLAGTGWLPLTLLLAAGRTKELSPERLEMFTEFSRGQGLTDDEILILPQTGEAGSTGMVLGSRG